MIISRKGMEICGLAISVNKVGTGDKDSDLEIHNRAGIGHVSRTRDLEIHNRARIGHVSRTRDWVENIFVMSTKMMECVDKGQTYGDWRQRSISVIKRRYGKIMTV